MPGDHLFFGNENSGIDGLAVPDDAVKVHIPMPGPVRSLNLSNAVAVVVYEAHRQTSGGGVVE